MDYVKTCYTLGRWIGGLCIDMLYFGRWVGGLCIDMLYFGRWVGGLFIDMLYLLEVGWWIVYRHVIPWGGGLVDCV